MRLVKIGMASLDSTVGAVRSNARAIVRTARAMEAEGVNVACYPEGALGGYPAEDRVQWPAFVEAQHAALREVARETSDLSAVQVLGLVAGSGGRLYNVAAVIHGGEILGLVPKEKLPTYDVFYEARTLSRGAPGLSLDVDGVPLGDLLFELDLGVLAVEVCEDVWSPEGPMRRRSFSGAELVVNVSASPFRMGVRSTRRELLATRSADHQVTLVYVNRVGIQDGLVFDGGAHVYQNGRPILEAERFHEGYETCVVDLDRTTRLRRENTTWRSDAQAFLSRRQEVPRVRSRATTGDRGELTYRPPPGGSFFLPSDARPPLSPRQAALDDLFEALALGVEGYFRKAGDFRRLGVAVSGGRDSLLTLLVAWRARQRLAERQGEGSGEDPPELHAFWMPSRYSGADTREAAREICRELDVPLREVSIDDALDRETEAARAMLGGKAPTDVTRENIQARLRALRMWSWANSARGLFLQTGDMSEKAVGYTTIGGDLEGGLSVIANLPKTMVVALLRRLHDRHGFDAIARTLETVAGPELAEDQSAEEELMPFPILDACLHLYAAEKMTPTEVARALPSLFPDRHEEQLAAWAREFADRFDRSIFKWVQAPLSLHVGSLDLERERALQLPVVQDDEWRAR